MAKDYPGIVCTPDTCAGAPRLDGHRLTIYNVVSRLRLESPDEHLSDFPDIPLSQIRTALKYCQTRQCERDEPDHFCDGCTLRRIHDGKTFEEYIDSCGKIVTNDRTYEGSGDGVTVFTGTWSEFRDWWEGENGWELAEQISRRLGWNEEGAEPIAGGNAG